MAFQKVSFQQKHQVRKYPKIPLQHGFSFFNHTTTGSCWQNNEIPHSIILRVFLEQSEKLNLNFCGVKISTGSLFTYSSRCNCLILRTQAQTYPLQVFVLFKAISRIEFTYTLVLNLEQGKLQPKAFTMVGISAIQTEHQSPCFYKMKLVLN
ncbi:unnamed protein product (macronuclear) [Paramecium tetraurelia]|uniref:CFA20 domain-containing protein n=1 Tax=Paramecium tetraurelia TaxID=5888 RepID=A0CMS7_PARTE|nr:uncharacterized protein GSPATT00038711001 [Paramecium tetraurelia]CAK72094.1 unnamed protein product [Paramecium tetraurelia]|eukprot:XP_001439491.1 hypothetical protein (macronuclear) [Paramecium tetraurelia strain d4-2]